MASKTKTVPKSYKTSELSFFQKLAQVYWFNPKSWLLDEFIIDGDTITIRTKAGKELKGKLRELRIRVQADKYERREVFIQKDKEKSHFKEIPWMLTDEEWDEIFEVLNSAPDSGATKLSWFVTALKWIIKIFE